jgi:Flp pilus assembly protein TadD
VLIGGALLVALCAASFGRHYSAHVYAERAREALPASPRTALARTGSSLQLNPYAAETLYARAAAYARLDDYARARESLMRAAAQEPLNFVPWALIGDLAARRREMAQARAAYRHAAKLNPRDAQLAELAADPSRALS